MSTTGPPYPDQLTRGEAFEEVCVGAINLNEARHAYACRFSAGIIAGTAFSHSQGQRAEELTASTISLLHPWELT
jgi:hypothetical protein